MEKVLQKTFVLYFDKEHLCKRLQLHDDGKKTNNGIVIFLIKIY